MIAFDALALSEYAECSLDLEAKRRELERKIEALRDEAENLRNEARSLESDADRQERALESLKKPNEETTAAQVAAWMLGSLGRWLSWAARSALLAAVECDDLRRVRAVAVLYGVILPAELLPKVPDIGRITNVQNPVAGLSLFSPEGL